MDRRGFLALMGAIAAGLETPWPQRTWKSERIVPVARYDLIRIDDLNAYTAMCDRIFEDVWDAWGATDL